MLEDLSVKIKSFGLRKAVLAGRILSNAKDTYKLSFQSNGIFMMDKEVGFNGAHYSVYVPLALGKKKSPSKGYLPKSKILILTHVCRDSTTMAHWFFLCPVWVQLEGINKPEVNPPVETQASYCVAENPLRVQSSHENGDMFHKRFVKLID
ncbi:hypothetical protein J6590_065620 [Homalodisca vitripennis]|nr:hypothetical protein J6590_065620 [Homalodisca vitripennis]